MTEKVNKKPAKPKKSKELCYGCVDNFYNGNNPFSIKECWRYPTSKLQLCKVVGTWDNPPWEHQPIKWVLNCKKAKGLHNIFPHTRTC